MPKVDLNGLIASLLSLFFTPKGLLAFILGLAIGFLIAVAPFILIALIVIVLAVLVALRNQVDFKKIKALVRGNPPSPRENTKENA